MKPLPWSFSALNNSHNCPHKHAEVSIHKRVSDDHSANEWGSWVHKQIEEHYRPAVPPAWHPNLLPYVPHIERAIAWAGEGPRYIEMKMGIARNLQAVPFFSPDVWGRAVIDYIVLDPDRGIAHVIDWKAGKVKPDIRQMKLFALFTFYHFPRVAVVETSLEWLQHGQETRHRFVATDVQDLWREFLPALTEYKRMFKEELFPKKPSGLCGWCPVQSCEHWRDRK